MYNSAQHKWIDPDTGQERYEQSYDTNNGFDWTQGVNWSTSPGAVDNSQTVRNLYYQAQLNWVRSFGKHNVTAMGLFSRQENARGSVMPTYRELIITLIVILLSITVHITVLRNSVRKIVSLFSIPELLVG